MVVRIRTKRPGVLFDLLVKQPRGLITTTDIDGFRTTLVDEDGFVGTVVYKEGFGTTGVTEKGFVATLVV